MSEKNKIVVEQLGRAAGAMSVIFDYLSHPASRQTINTMADLYKTCQYATMVDKYRIDEENVKRLSTSPTTQEFRNAVDKMKASQDLVVKYQTHAMNPELAGILLNGGHTLLTALLLSIRTIRNSVPIECPVQPLFDPIQKPVDKEEDETDAAFTKERNKNGFTKDYMPAEFKLAVTYMQKHQWYMENETKTYYSQEDFDNINNIVVKKYHPKGTEFTPFVQFGVTPQFVDCYRILILHGINATYASSLFINNREQYVTKEGELSTKYLSENQKKRVQNIVAHKLSMFGSGSEIGGKRTRKTRR